MVSLYLIAALFMAQDAPATLPVTVTYAHLPVYALKAVMGSVPKRVGMYAATVCNAESDKDAKLSEGLLIQEAERFGVIDPALNSTMIDLAKRKAWTYKVWKGLEYGGQVMGAATGPSGKAGIKFAGLLLTGAAREAAGIVSRDANVPLVVTQALVVSSRKMLLEPGDCESRLMFGEYRESFKPYTVKVEVRQILK